jgi:uncharacterized protein
MENEIILKTIDYVKQNLIGDPGHDLEHAYRVWDLGKKISKLENANLEIVEPACLLHDIADAKFCDGNESIGPQKAYSFLTSLNLEEEKINPIMNIITYLSFRKRNEMLGEKSIEFQVVQDADRLDAIGAIGIARAFSYGGFKERKIYNPKNMQDSTIGHFYDKLLLLKDLMNTKTGKEIAEQRHQFMELYLKQFFDEVGEDVS